jgi:hypothetical protein
MKGEDGKPNLFSNKSLLSLLSRGSSKSHERHQSKGTPPTNQDRLLRKKPLEMDNLGARTTTESRSSSQSSLNSGYRTKEKVERISNGVNIYVSNINIITNVLAFTTAIHYFIMIYVYFRAFQCIHPTRSLILSILPHNSKLVLKLVGVLLLWFTKLLM